METKISEKIELFKNGYITDEQEIIDYDANLLNRYYDVINEYWSEELQYYVKNFLTESDLLPSHTFPISGEDYEASGATFDIGDIETEIGLDFQEDLELTGAYYDAVSDNIDEYSEYLQSIINDAIGPVSGEFIEDQYRMNETIKEDEKSEVSPGLLSIIKLNCLYLDTSDTDILFRDKYAIAIKAGDNDISDEQLNKLVNDISELIIQSNYYNFGEKISICKEENLMYAMLSDKTIETNVQELLYETYPDDDLSIRIARAGLKLMPDNETIYKNTSQYDLMYTAKSLIDEIDIYRNAVIAKGLM